MKTKPAIATLAIIAAFASLGTAHAGERYDRFDGAFVQPGVSAPLGAVTWQGGGELYPVTGTLSGTELVATPTPSIYATGGELFSPISFGGARPIDTDAAE